MEKDILKENTKGKIISDTSKPSLNGSIECALKGCTCCPVHDCDGYHRQCDFWKRHSSK